MTDLLKVLVDTPVPMVLVVGGIFFLFLAIGGQFGAKIITDQVKQKAAGVLGVVLLLSGLGFYLIPQPPLTSSEQSANSASPVSPLPSPEQSVLSLSIVPMGNWEVDVDRMGLDYRDFNLERADPLLCQEACAQGQKCRAWTYVKPNTTQGPRPRCWLKHAVPQSIKHSCCVSGVKHGA